MFTNLNMLCFACYRPVVNMDDQDRVTAAAIARRAGVGRAAVSNWRRRYPHFPQPVGGTASSPVFSWEEVLKWLHDTGKAGQLVTMGRTDTGTHRIDDAEPVAELSAAVPQERAIADLEPQQLLARVMAAVLPYPDAGDLDGGEPPVVLDPACGAGTLLLAVADRFGDQVKLVGQEIEDEVAARAGTELRNHPHAPLHDVQEGDSLRDNRLTRYLGAAAAVACIPPRNVRQWPVAELAADPRWRFGIPDAGDPELAWVQHCYAHLRPRGVAVVAVSLPTCSRPSGQAVRAELVRSGALRDVIALPKGVGSEDGLHLWVLQRPYGAPEGRPVRMADLSGLADPADVPHENGAWKRLFADADPAVVRTVPRLELLDGDTALLPSRFLSSRQAAAADDLAELTARLRAAYSRLGRAFPRPAEARSRPDRPQVTVAELERAGALTIRPRDTTPRTGDVLLRTLGRPPVVAQGSPSDENGVAQVIEIDPVRLDPHFVAMFLRADAGALPVANTHGALSRDDLRRCRLPRMLPAEQRRYGESFRHLLDLQHAVEALAAVSTSVLDQTIHSLTTGALAPQLHPARESISADPTESEST
jgi:SAM-dependent methyltransferase